MAAASGSINEAIPQHQYHHQQQLVQQHWVTENSFVAWLRSEFAAANAIIDALLYHMQSNAEQPADYDGVFAAVQQRRFSWTPVILMQQHFSIAEIYYALQQATTHRQMVQPTVGLPRGPVEQQQPPPQQHKIADSAGGKDLRRSGYDYHAHRFGKHGTRTAGVENGKMEEAIREEIDKEENCGAHPEKEGNGASSTTDVECHMEDEGRPLGTNYGMNGDEPLQCGTTTDEDEKQTCKLHFRTFFSSVTLDGKMVNAVDGLKLYEHLFDNSETTRFLTLANEMRAAGRRGELQGQTMILSKRPSRGHGRDMIQLGVAVADGPLDADNYTGTYRERKVEDIPESVHYILNHLVKKQVLAVKPNFCAIDFFNEGDHSQPYMWPLWYGRPVCSLFLTECDMVFGQVIGTDYRRGYKGSLKVNLKPGNLLVLEGNSADLARHAIPSVRKQRVIMTFGKFLSKKSLPLEGPRFPSATQPVSSRWTMPHARPSFVRHSSSVSKQHGTTAGVFSRTTCHQQLAPQNGTQPLYVSAAAAPVPPSPIPYPTIVPQPPVSAGSIVTIPPHRAPVPGTGVFLPPPGSGNPLPQFQEMSLSADCSCSQETAAYTENRNIAEKAQSSHSSPGPECIGSTRDGLVGNGGMASSKEAD